MLNLTRKTDYALVALAFLGNRREVQEGPASATLIAEQFGMPKALLMNIMKELAQGKLVTSTRGARGGYELAIAPQRISLLNVVTIIEGPMRLTECADSTLPIVGQGCTLADGCPIRTPIRRLNDRINRFLEEVTLADLLTGDIDVARDAVTADGDELEMNTAGLRAGV